MSNFLKLPRGPKAHSGSELPHTGSKLPPHWIRSPEAALWRFSAFRLSLDQNSHTGSQFSTGPPLPSLCVGKSHTERASALPRSFGAFPSNSTTAIPPENSGSDLAFFASHFSLWIRSWLIILPELLPPFPCPSCPRRAARARVGSSAFRRSSPASALALCSRQSSLRRALVRRFGGVRHAHAVQPRAGQPRGPRRALRAAESIIPHSASVSRGAI